MKSSLNALWYGLLVVLLVACGGYEDDGAPPELLGNNEGATSLFLAVEATTPSLRSAGTVASQGRARQENLSRDAFRPVALVPDSTAVGGFREVDIGVFEFENRGSGLYRVAIDGEPRVNVVIFATVNGVTFKYLVLEPGSESEPLVIDIETTAATEVYLEAVEQQGGFSDVDLDEAQQVFEQTRDVIASSTPPPSGEDPVEYYKNQAKDTCTLDVAIGASTCPRKVKGTVAGLTAGEVRLELNGDREIQVRASGGFEFADLLPVGADFDVQVSRQPDSLFCAVTSGGSGVIGTNDSFAVVVNCSPAATYSVGGNVSGLIGSLDLALNGNAQTVDSNGAGSFDQRLLSGTAYTVTIVRQPTGQQCSLQNGSGTVGNTDVTNILVTCVSNPYTIGGSVSGLNGSVTLLLDGGNALAVTGVGTQPFTFGATKPFNSTYSVTVGTQPSGQLCSVSPQTSSGTVGAGNVTSVSVSCISQFAVTGQVVGSGSIVSGTGVFAAGTVTNIAVQASPNYYLQSMEGCSNLGFQNSNQTLTQYTYPTAPVTQACTVTATFALKTYTVTTTATNGAITSTLNPAVNHGATTTVTGAANDGYYFTGVSGCGGTAQTNNSNDQSVTTFTYPTGSITQACSVTATFALKNYTVTTTATNGAITSTLNPTVNHGATTTVTGAANDGYYFTGVSGCGGTAQTNSSNDQSITTFNYATGAVTQACTVSATFAVKTYTVSTSAQDGQITSTPNPVVNHGGATTVEGSANQGYYFSNVTGCGGTAQTNTNQSVLNFSYPTGAVTANCSVDALFLRRTFTVTTSAGTGGQITSAAAPLVNFGSTTTVSVAADTGYYVSGISGCGGTPFSNTDQSVATQNFTTAIIQADCAVAATFAVKTYAVTTSISNGTLTPSTSPLTVNHGAATTISATADAGYYITSVNSSCGGSVPVSGADQSRISVSYTTAAITSACSVSVQTAQRTPRTIGGTVLGFGTRPPQTFGGVSLALKDTAGGNVLGTVTLSNDQSTSAPFGFTTAQSQPVTRYTGETYSVEVTTQPQGLVCDVAHPSGTVGAGDVTDVAVFCQTFPQYLQGVWSRQEGNALSLVRFRSDDSYLMARANPSQPASTGFEYGNASIDPLTGAVQDVGTQSDSLPGGLSHSGFSKTLSFRNSKLVITSAPDSDPANTTEEEWTRVQPDALGLGGAWTGNEGLDSRFLIAVLPATNTYMLVDPTAAASAPACEVPGIEYGTYAYNPQTRSIDFSNVVVDTNGCGGAHNPVGDTYDSLTQIYLVDLDGNPAQVEGWRLLPGGGNVDMLLREGYLPQPAFQVTSALTGTWTSFQTRTPTVTYQPDEREVYRFDTPDSINQRISYLNGIVHPSYSGIEGGRFTYNERAGNLTVYTGLDTNGAAGGLATEANVYTNGSPIPGTSDSPRVHVYIEYDGVNPVVLHTYDFVDNDARQYIRGPQRQSGELTGTWIEGDISFFSPVVMFFEDQTYFLLDPQGTYESSCAQTQSSPQPGMEFGNWTYTSPTLGISLSLSQAVADTNGCGGFWNSELQVSNLTSASVLVSGGTDPVDVSDDVLNIGGTVLNRVPNNGTVPLQPSYIVRGSASLDGATVLISLKDGVGVTLETQTLVGQSSFEFQHPFADLSSFEVVVQSQSQDKQCSVSPATGQIDGSDAVLVVTCAAPVLTVGGTVNGLRVGEQVVLEIQQVPAPATNPAPLYLSGTQTQTQGFTFQDVPFQTGDTYQVKVTSEPAQRYCSIQNASGTMPSFSITNVTVNCFDNTVEIGEIRPATPVIGGVVSVSGFGFASADVYLGGQLIDLGAQSAYRTNHEVRFVVPNLAAGQHELRITAMSNGQESGGDGRIVGVAERFRISTDPSVRAGLAIGGSHTCGIGIDFNIYCWGVNELGQLGRDTSIQNQSLPSIVPGIADARSIVAGENHTCARFVDGTVKCWGQNDSGQLGNDGGGVSTYLPQSVIVAPGTPLSGVTSLSAGANHTCAVSSGNVYCWGSNVSSQIDSDLKTPSLPMATQVQSGTATRVVSGSNFNCAQMSGNTIACWGENLNGQVGEDPSTVQTVAAANASVTTDASDMTAGGEHLCVVIASTGQVACRGSNYNGELLKPIRGLLFSHVLQTINGLSASPSAIAAGNDFTCATTPTGNVQCWGGNGVGQLGDGRVGYNGPDIAVLPDLVRSASGVSYVFAAVSYGNARACGADGSGRLRCWGSSSFTALRGDDQPVSQQYANAVTLPLADVGAIVTGGRDASQSPNVSGGSVHTCALTTSGNQQGVNAVSCSGTRGFLADAGYQSSSVLQTVPGLGNPQAIAAGDLHTCASNDASTIHCWGDPTFGAFGSSPDFSGGPVLTLTGVLPSTPATGKVLSAGRGHTCARADDGLYCWGDNTFGQLGFSFSGSTFTPQKIQELAVPDDFDLGGDFGCAVIGGAIRCWGDNSVRQLGDPSFTDPNSVSPTSVQAGGFTITDAFKVAAGYQHGCAIVSSGQVRCWGNNGDGQVGQPNAGAGQGANVWSSAQLVPGVTGAQDIAAGDITTCVALGNGGRVYCWGHDIENNTSFSQFYVKGAGSVTGLSLGRDIGCGVVSNTEAQCWGKNYVGELGIPVEPSYVRFPVPGP